MLRTFQLALLTLKIVKIYPISCKYTYGPPCFLLKRNGIQVTFKETFF